ncbi:MAG: hypothetical protein WCJ18_00640 [Planctomycetota bacterium]
MKQILCLYTCPQDREHLAALEDTALLRQVRSDPNFLVWEVHASDQLTQPEFGDGRLIVPGREAYTHLSLKTYEMIRASLAHDFAFLLKVDATLAGYERKLQQKPADVLARLTPNSALAALGDPSFFDSAYNGLVKQQATREGFESWMRTKGLNCDFRAVFPGDGPTPPYYLGKFYVLRRDFCEFIAAHAEAMAREHVIHLGGSEDLMIGRLHERWRDQRS